MPQYYLADSNNNRRGPFPPEQLPSQGLTPETLVWCEGMADWQRADSVAELRPLLPAPQPVYHQPQYPQQPQYQQPYPQQGYPQGPLSYQNQMPVQGGAGMGITSMVLGILSLLLLWAWCAGIPLGILAIIFGALGVKKPGKGMAVAGLVCGCIAIGLALLVLIIWGAIIANL